MRDRWREVKSFSPRSPRRSKVSRRTFARAAPPIQTPGSPEPAGTYVKGVRTGNLLFMSGMLPTEGHGAKFIGRVGAELDVEAGRKAALLAALNVLAVATPWYGRKSLTAPALLSPLPLMR